MRCCRRVPHKNVHEETDERARKAWREMAILLLLRDNAMASRAFGKVQCGRSKQIKLVYPKRDVERDGKLRFQLSNAN